MWILRVHLLTGLIFISTGHDAHCPLELSPPSLAVKFGEPLNVECSTTETEKVGMGWEAPNWNDGLVNRSNLNWTVAQMTHWDNRPMCYLLYPNGTTCLKVLTVVVYTFPDITTIRLNNNSTLIENEEYEFTCEILNIAPVRNLTINWYKGDQIIETDTVDNEIKIPQNKTFVSKFIPKRTDNNTVFRCEAFMDLRPEGPLFSASPEEYKIEVFLAREIDCLKKFDLMEGDSLEGKCKVTGNPAPLVEWLKDGHPINPANPLTRNDTGLYTVKATNFRDLEKNVQVNVLFGPEWLCPQTYTALEFSRWELSCSRGFPEPREIWYKNDEEVELPDILIRSHAGQYLVMASNTLSNQSFEIDINVLYPPSEIIELVNSEVQAGATVGLKCSSVGKPPVEYLWSYYKTANVMERTEDGVSLLIIHNATGYNAGNYTCAAGNAVGDVSKTVRVTVKGAKQECPVEVTPNTLVLQYGSRGKSAECRSKTNVNNIAVHWKIHDMNLPNTTWTPDTSIDWDPSPACFGEFQGIGNCSKPLRYILYKTPVDVSIDAVNNSGSLLEGSELQLLCNVMNVAPAQNVKVRWVWRKGNETIDPESLGVRNNQTCSTPRDKSPVNLSCSMNITLKRAHNAMEAICEVKLDLGPEGPQPPPVTESSSFNISVHYGPLINTTKLPEVVPVISGYYEELVCEADGNPPPNITWQYGAGSAQKKLDGKLIVEEAGSYTCIAENYLNKSTHVVEVVLKADYLPLIAGFVALTVVIISIVFVFIYSIYYKNTKMRRYSLKNPKLSSHHGNVAHNGWDVQLPVTKLY